MEKKPLARQNMPCEKAQWIRDDEISRKPPTSASFPWRVNRQREAVRRRLEKRRQGNDWQKKKMVRWTQVCKLSCFIRCSAVGERQSPHVAYRFTVNDMIDAEKSRGEGSGALYLEQVAIRAWKEMTCSCGSGLAPTHRGPGWLSHGIPQLTWLLSFKKVSPLQ